MTRKAKPRVLFLASRPPHPPHSGGQLFMWQLIRNVVNEVDVHLRVLSEHLEDSVSAELAAFSASATVATTEVPEPSLLRTLPRRMSRHWSWAYADEIRAMVHSGDYDLVHVESYFLAQHVPDPCPLPIYLLDENVESDLDRQRQENSGGKGEDEPGWEVSRRMEEAAWQRAARVGCITPEDAKSVQQRMPNTPVDVIPMGWDHLGPLRLQPDGERRPPTATFLGNYSWAPTADAALQILSQLWPRICAEIPGARLRFIGAAPSDEMYAEAARLDGVEIVGAVSSLMNALRAGDVFLAPIRFGSGVRVKIIDALSAGMVVVTTSKGAQGVPDPFYRHLFVRDDIDAMVRTVVDLLRNPGKLASVSQAVLADMSDAPTWSEAAARLLTAWRLAAESRRPGESGGIR